MTPEPKGGTSESFWIQRLDLGAGACVSLESGPGQVIEGFWRDLFSTAPLGARILEIGCGSGEVSTWAAAAGRKLRIVASDIHDRPELVRVRSDVAFVGDAWAEALPFAPASFDMVVSNFAFEYAADRNAAAVELGRVLVPGGRTALVIHSEDSAVTAASRELLRVHEQLARADIPTRLCRAAALRPDHLSRRKLLKEVLALRGRFPPPRPGLSAALYFELAERLLKRDPAARRDLSELESMAARLVDMSEAQVAAALDTRALGELARQLTLQGMEVHSSRITGCYETGAVQKIAWLVLAARPREGS
jgi:SAM-dependent methyltransferase